MRGAKPVTAARDLAGVYRAAAGDPPRRAVLRTPGTAHCSFRLRSRRSCRRCCFPRPSNGTSPPPTEGGSAELPVAAGAATPRGWLSGA